MRILILANNDSGLYKFRKELLETFVEDNEVYCCVPEGEYIDAIKQIGCKYIQCSLLELHGTNPFKDLQLLRYYKQVVREIHPSIVFTYTIKPNIYGGMACASLGIPYVANITGLGTAVENGGLMQLLTTSLYKYALRKAQKVFFQNSENRDFMVGRRIVKGPYDLLPGSGVNLASFPLLPYPKGKTIDFVFIARVMKEKGIDQYLEAAQIIRQKHPEAVFHICGYSDGYYQQLLRKLHEEGVIVYHGLVRNMLDIYHEMSCTVHPTYYPEGLSNVLLESAACGRPIISTDRSGCREVVDDGINGYVVHQQDSQDLAAKIERFLSLNWESKKQMGLAGRNKVETEFDRNIVIEKYMCELER